jgi:uncharacterized integral membrane protein (TIGR00697 family)
MTQSPEAGTVRAPELSRAALVYVWLACFFCACLIVADLVGVKLFRIPLGFSVPVFWSDTPISAIEHTCGMLTFPVTFLLTDLLNEYYGKRAARRVVLIAFAMALFVFVVMNVAQAMPHWDAPFNVTRESFAQIFGSAKVMYVASLAAYLVGNLCDIAMFAWIKRATRGRMIWLRATGSTVASQMIDSLIVTYLAFSLGRTLFPDPSGPSAMGMGEVLATAATGYLLKFFIAIAMTPLIYAGRGFLHKVLGLTPLAPE